MTTRFPGQITLPQMQRQDNTSQSNDVWVSQTSVIEEWGLGEADLWQRLIDRHNEVLTTGAVPVSYWAKLDQGLDCTCIKPETGQGFARCRVCFGTAIVGGFEKYGFNTLNLAANSPLTLDSGLVILKQEPWQLQLAPGALVGTARTGQFLVEEALNFDSFQIIANDGPRQLTQNRVLVEYSVDNGNTYTALTSDLTALNEPALTVQFRITLSRADAKDPMQNPALQAFRTRWQVLPSTNVFISKRSFPEQRWLESFGVRVKLDGITWWSTPNLGVPGGDIIHVEEDDVFEIEAGAYKPQTLEEEDFPISGLYKPTAVTYVEPKGHFISQRFSIRALQRDEPENEIF